jgi:8-oxo-dGTP pyrophosphatase MutT (NUDIX family)
MYSKVMAKLHHAAPSAVAILETPDHFLTEGRPDREGSLAYSGRIQLFGGHMDEGELQAQTIRRELREELGLELPTDPKLLWSGQVESQLRDGSPALRQVSLFHVSILNIDGMTMRVPGEIVSILKTTEDLEEYRDRLTQFAYDSLSKFLRGEYATVAYKTQDLCNISAGVRYCKLKCTRLVL